MDGIKARARELYNATEARWGTDAPAVFQALEGLERNDRIALQEEYFEVYKKDLVTVLQSEMSGTKLRRALSLLSNGKADWTGAGVDYRVEGLGDSFSELAETFRHHPLISTGILGGGVYVSVKSPAAAAVAGLVFLGAGAVKVVKNEVEAALAKDPESKAQQLIESGNGIGQTLMAVPGTGRSVGLIKGGVLAAKSESTLGARTMAFLKYQPPRPRPLGSATAGEAENLGKSVSAFYQGAVKEALAPLAEHFLALSPAQREVLLKVSMDPKLLSAIARHPENPANFVKLLKSFNLQQQQFILDVTADKEVMAGLNQLTKLFGPALEALKDLPIAQRAELLRFLTDPALMELEAGETFARLLLTMGPGHVKLGQIAADAGGLPPQVAASLRKLQGEIPAMGEAAVQQRLVDAGLAGKYKPGQVLGVASIGQVNEATEIATGEQVVLKMLRPGVSREIVEGEFRVMEAILKPYRKTLSPEKAALMDDAIRDFQRGILEEIDLHKEAANMTRFGELSAGESRFTTVQLRELAADGSVLVMSKAQGVHINQIKDAVLRVRAGENLAKSVSKQTFETGVFHADPHPGNFRVLPDGRIEFLDLGALGTVTAAERLALQKTAVFLLAQDAERLAKHLIAEAGSITSSLPRAELQAKLAAHFKAAFATPDFDTPRLLKNLDQLQKMAAELGVHPKKGSFWLLKTLYTTNNIYRQLKPHGELAVEAIPSILKGLYRSFKADPKGLRSHILEIAAVVGMNPRQVVKSLVAAGVADPRKVADLPRGFYTALQALRFDDE